MPEVHRCRDLGTANLPRDCELAANRSVKFHAGPRLVNGPRVGTFVTDASKFVVIRGVMKRNTNITKASNQAKTLGFL
jgi:hypothetical protein